MCRLSAITSGDYFSPMENILALETMKEGHDGSGLGLMLKELGCPFAEYKGLPVLSAICSNRGLQDLDEYMKAQGFREKFVWTPIIRKAPGIERREHYLANVYNYPESFRDKPLREKEDLLMSTRLGLRRLGEAGGGGGAATNAIIAGGVGRTSAAIRGMMMTAMMSSAWTKIESGTVYHFRLPRVIED